MRFSGAEPPTTTPCAFDSTGIIKTVKEKPNVPSARRIMDRLHVFRLPYERVCQASGPTQLISEKEILFLRKRYSETAVRDVCFGPSADIALPHSITSSVHPARSAMIAKSAKWLYAACDWKAR